MWKIEVQGVSKRYGAVQALSDVHLQVGSGEIFGIIGPDGAGKTTLFRILATLLTPDSGTARVDGLSVGTGRLALRRRIGYMPGRFALYPDLSIEENIRFFASAFHVPYEEGLALVRPIYEQIEPYRKRRAGKLSGGMKQKLALCCALIHKPAVLLLDEPTTGVDAVSRAEFWDHLARLRADGLTILAATPYMDEAARCDRIALISEGRILATDSPAALLEKNRAQSIEDVFIALMSRPASHLPETASHLDETTSHPLETASHAEKLPSLGRKSASLGRKSASLGSESASLGSKSASLGSETISPPSEFAIEVRGLTKRFGDFTAVRGINLSVRRGEIFGFLGANGAGKTTAMRMLCGLSRPTAGSGTVAGLDVLHESERIKQKIGYMSQRFSLYDDLTVWQNIQFFAGVYDLSPSRTEERGHAVLEALDFLSHRGEKVKDIPLGWKQKLAFAVAMLPEPEIVFLDEPTGGVDPIVRRQFWEMIRQTARTGVTIFVTTHYMDEAELCDRLSIMVDGEIRALDTPARLRQQYGAGSMDEVFRQICRGI